MDALQQIIELEAMADVMQQKVIAFKNFCHQQRRKLEGVSTSSNARKGLSEVQVASQILRRRKRING